MTDETESFTREVDEQLRQDRTMEMLRQYGPWVAGAALAAILGLAGWITYDNIKVSNARAQYDVFAAAQDKLQNGDLAGAKTDFEALTESGPQAYRIMAMMHHAGLLEAEGDLTGALARFDEAAEAATDDVSRNTARMRAAYIVADTQDYQALQARLEPLIAEDGPVSFLARELLAVEAWEAGDIELARETFDGLFYALDAPESVRQRVGFARAVIGSASGDELQDGAASSAPEETPTGDQE